MQRPHLGLAGTAAPLMFLSLASFVPAAHGSTLDRVLHLIDQMYSGPDSPFIMANIAVTSPTLQERPRLLAPGDTVIIGYDIANGPVYATAGLSGLSVTQADAAKLTRGVAAGLYPPGSALYALPPAGQLSIHAETVAGTPLGLAQETVMARIDGTVFNTILGVYSGLAGEVQVAKVNPAVNVVGTIGTTVLGAVNSGEIVTHVRLVTDPLAQMDFDQIDPAILARGADMSKLVAVAGAAKALSLDVSPTGSMPNQMVMSLNLASNRMEITGRVRTIAMDTALIVDHVTTTVLGAVNTGSVSSP